MAFIVMVDLVIGVYNVAGLAVRRYTYPVERTAADIPESDWPLRES